jgi:hypothetical protein
MAANGDAAYSRESLILLGMAEEQKKHTALLERIAGAMVVPEMFLADALVGEFDPDVRGDDAAASLIRQSRAADDDGPNEGPLPRTLVRDHVEVRDPAGHPDQITGDTVPYRLATVHAPKEGSVVESAVATMPNGWEVYYRVVHTDDGGRIQLWLRTNTGAAHQLWPKE